MAGCYRFSSPSQDAGVAVPSDLIVAAAVGFVSAAPSGILLAPVRAAHQTRPLRRLLVFVAAASLVVALLRAPFSPRAPKRLLVHHVQREVDGEPLDSGLWISAFDFSGLRELKDLRSAIGLDVTTADSSPPSSSSPSPFVVGTSRTVPRACSFDLATTGCYLSLPFYFPLGGIAGTPTASVHSTPPPSRQAPAEQAVVAMSTARRMRRAAWYPSNRRISRRPSASSSPCHVPTAAAGAVWARAAVTSVCID